MGGLVNGTTVKGDLWMIEAGGGNLACYPVGTTFEGPGPRVGHASLLVGNAFIVFGGDTKMDDRDSLDDTLYLLNTCKFPFLGCNGKADIASHTPMVAIHASRPEAGGSIRAYAEYTGVEDLHIRWPSRRLLLQ